MIQPRNSVISLREKFLRIMTNLLLKLSMQMLALGFFNNRKEGVNHFAKTTIDREYLNTETGIADETGLLF